MTRVPTPRAIIVVHVLILGMIISYASAHQGLLDNTVRSRGSHVLIGPACMAPRVSIPTLVTSVFVIQVMKAQTVTDPSMNVNQILVLMGVRVLMNMMGSIVCAQWVTLAQNARQILMIVPIALVLMEVPVLMVLIHMCVDVCQDFWASCAKIMLMIAVLSRVLMVALALTESMISSVSADQDGMDVSVMKMCQYLHLPVPPHLVKMVGIVLRHPTLPWDTDALVLMELEVPGALSRPPKL